MHAFATLLALAVPAGPVPHTFYGTVLDVDGTAAPFSALALVHTRSRTPGGQPTDPPFEAWRLC